MTAEGVAEEVAVTVMICLLFPVSAGFPGTAAAGAGLWITCGSGRRFFLQPESSIAAKKIYANRFCLLTFYPLPLMNYNLFFD